MEQHGDLTTDSDILEELHETKELTPRSLAACALLGLLFGCGGVAAVFTTGNELGTAALLLSGFAFLLIAVLGHVPRFSVGGASIDAEQYSTRIRRAERRGRLAENAQSQELAESTDDPSEVAEALEARRAELRAIEGRSGARDSAPPAARPQPSSRRDPRLSADVAAMLDRFASFDSSVDHHSVAARLLDLGYIGETPRGRGGAPARATYIRWVLTGKAKPVKLYQNSAGLVSDNQPQLEFAQSIPVGHREGSVHPKVRFYYASSSVPQVLEVAERFLDYAAMP